MNIIIINYSRKKSFRKTKRVVSSVLPSITNRVNFGNIPKRVIIKLIKDLKSLVSKGVIIKVFIESKEGYRGFKCIEIGKKDFKYEFWINTASSIDKDIP